MLYCKHLFLKKQTKLYFFLPPDRLIWSPSGCISNKSRIASIIIGCFTCDRSERYLWETSEILKYFLFVCLLLLESLLTLQSLRTNQFNFYTFTYATSFRFVLSYLSSHFVYRYFFAQFVHCLTVGAHYGCNI
jgi:hypothetical protein